MNYPTLSSAALQVQEFHAFFKGIIRRAVTRIVGEELDFRKNLLREEYEELMEALDGDDVRQQYKELADLIYVAYGLDAHMGGYLDQVIEAVHASNMSKLWDCECIGTRGMGALSECPKCHGTGQYAKYREDGKVLKPPTYTKADLSFLPENPPTKDER